MKYGIKWQQFNKKDQIVTKEKFFETETARDNFANKIEKKDNFYRFDAWLQNITNIY